ncbi:hypothetical protein [Azospirillum doebereinerae]
MLLHLSTLVRIGRGKLYTFNRSYNRISDFSGDSLFPF